MSSVYTAAQQRISAEIAEAEARRENIIRDLELVNNELDKAASQIAIYEKLDEVSLKLGELHQLGGGQLFWGDKFTSDDEHVSYLNGLHNKSQAFKEEIDVVRDRKSNLDKQVRDITYEIGGLKEELEIVKHEEAESKHDFVIQREYQPRPYRAAVMPWSNKGEDEKRFRKYLLLAFLYSILFGLVIPYIQLPVPEKEEVVEVPERIAKFIKKKQPQPKPKQQTQSTEKAKPTQEEKTKAREKAAKTGLLAFKNNFADLMDDVSEAKLGSNAKLSDEGATAKSTSRSLVLSQAKAGSGGINASSLSRDTGVGGKIGAVKFSRVTSDIGTAADGSDRPLSSGPGPSRTDEEIQIIFDRYKAALYRIYNRELRKNPTLQGKMVLRITIQPDGTVSVAKVESTTLDSALLSKQIVERVKRFNFGAKKDVPAITILYPIDFLPAT